MSANIRATLPLVSLSKPGPFDLVDVFTELTGCGAGWSRALNLILNSRFSHA